MNYANRASKRRPMAAVISTVVVTLLGLMLSPPAAGAAGAGAGSGHTWYLDCSAVATGSGTFSHPLNTLQAANRLVLGPGDRLLLRRGSTCTGSLQPQGGGAPGSPVVIGAYSNGPSRQLPAINGGGGVVAAVWVADMSYVTVEDLALTNSGDSIGIHRGLYFTSSAGPVVDVTVRGLYVHNVDSNAAFSESGKRGGGIVGQTLSAAGRFSGVSILNNDVEGVSRQGITIYGTTSSSRPPATSPWPAASTGVVIAGNVVRQVQGDGIVPLGTDGAVVEGNVVQQAGLSGLDFESANRDCSAGIWTWNANNTLIRYNEASDTVYGPSTDPQSLNGCDGEGFDADYNQDGTVIEYNFSHDNAGGFVLLCTDQSPHRIVIRYNLSVDDNATFNPTPCANVIDPATNNLNGVQMYNNTIVAPTPRVTLELDESFAQQLTALDGTFQFENNIVDATSPDASNHFFGCGNECTNNLFFGLPSPSTARSSVTADPEFVAPQLMTPPGFLLRPGSPAIGAGTPSASAAFPPPATRDYFGFPVQDPPAIGFSER